MERTRASLKVKLRIKVMKLVEFLIGWKVIVTGQGLECHLTFVRGRPHIAEKDSRIDHKELLNYDFKRSTKYLCLSSLALWIKHSYEKHALAYPISWEIITPWVGAVEKLLLRNGKFVIWKLKSSRFRKLKCEVEHPSESIIVNLGKKRKWWSLLFPWSQVQQDQSGSDTFPILGCLWTIHHLCTY